MLRLRSRLTEKEKNAAFIIHIFHKYVPYQPITPTAHRLHSSDKTIKNQRWSFHAVLYVSGLILDLDYTNSPKLESHPTYFQKMWPQEELMNNYLFQIKPANLYHRFDTDGSMDEDLYPPMTFEELKSNLSSL
ncbi:MAG: hypothetical protein ACRBBP_07095 [Bdellovibrionales bacterium]